MYKTHNTNRATNKAKQTVQTDKANRQSKQTEQQTDKANRQSKQTEQQTNKPHKQSKQTEQTDRANTRSISFTNESTSNNASNSLATYPPSHVKAPPFRGLTLYHSI